MNKQVFKIILNGNELYRSYCNRQRAMARCELLAADTSVYVELWCDSKLIKYWN